MGQYLDLTVNVFYAGLISRVDKDGQDYPKELLKVMNQDDLHGMSWNNIIRFVEFNYKKIYLKKRAPSFSLRFLTTFEIYVRIPPRTQELRSWTFFVPQDRQMKHISKTDY